MAAAGVSGDDTAVRCLHRVAGEPAAAGCRRVDGGRCTVCALPVVRGMKYSRWQGANFTDQNKLRWIAGRWVCEACVWAHSWVRPPGHRPPEEGKRGPCLRHFSHLWDSSDGYVWVSKGDKSSIRDWLLADRGGDYWFAAIADSGQKHVLPRTPINPPGSGAGYVQFDEETVERPHRDLVDNIERVYSAGATKAEIETGRWRPRFLADQFGLVRAFEDYARPIRHGGTFRLALWLAQKGTE